MEHAFPQTPKRLRKGFSLVELVVTIIIIAVLSAAVFAGGSAVIKQAEISRVSSDLRNFSIACETVLNENASVTNIQNNKLEEGNKLSRVIKELNEALASEYRITTPTTPLSSSPNASTDNIRITADTFMTGSYLIFQSNKNDAWGNPYYVIFDCAERYENSSDFFITILSAGPNGQTNVGGTIDHDDIFLISECSDGNVMSNVFNCGKIESFQNTTSTSPITLAGRGSRKTGETENNATYTSVGGNSVTARTQTTARRHTAITTPSSSSTTTSPKTPASLDAELNPGAKSVYAAGEDFDASTITVTVVYSDGSSSKVTGYSIDGEGKNLKVDQSISLTYTENGVTLTATVVGVSVTADGNPPVAKADLIVEFYHAGGEDIVSSSDPALFNEEVTIIFTTANVTGVNPSEGEFIVQMYDTSSSEYRIITSGYTYYPVNGNEAIEFNLYFKKASGDTVFLKQVKPTLYAKTGSP